MPYTGMEQGANGETVVLPSGNPSVGQVLRVASVVGIISQGEWYTPAAPDLSAYATGPASSVDNTLPRFDGTGGKTLQGSGVVVDDSNNVTVPGAGTFNGGNIQLTNVFGLPALWLTSDTPTSSNFAILGAVGQTIVNTGTGTTLDLRVGNSTVAAVSSTGLAVTGVVTASSRGSSSAPAFGVGPSAEKLGMWSQGSYYLNIGVNGNAHIQLDSAYGTHFPAGPVSFASHVLPEVNNTADVGATGARFRNGWFADSLIAQYGNFSQNVAATIGFITSGYSIANNAAMNYGSAMFKTIYGQGIAWAVNLDGTIGARVYSPSASLVKIDNGAGGAAGLEVTGALTLAGDLYLPNVKLSQDSDNLKILSHDGSAFKGLIASTGLFASTLNAGGRITSGTTGMALDNGSGYGILDSGALNANGTIFKVAGTQWGYLNSSGLLTIDGGFSTSGNSSASGYMKPGAKTIATLGSASAAGVGARYSLTNAGKEGWEVYSTGSAWNYAHDNSPV